MIEWFEFNTEAQNVWLILHKFGYHPDVVKKFPLPTYLFLVSGLDWYYGRLKGASKNKHRNREFKQTPAGVKFGKPRH